MRETTIPLPVGVVVTESDSGLAVPPRDNAGHACADVQARSATKGHAGPDATARLATQSIPLPICGRCDGCGRIADSTDGEPWTAWQELTPPSNLAVLAGIVRPMPCPDCGGTGGAR